MASNDPLLKIKANNKLSDIQLKADLTSEAEDFASKLVLKAPELKQITTPEELKGLIDAIKAGTASNNQLTKFVKIADKILSKL